jgi:hypothetical protein
VQFILRMNMFSILGKAKPDAGNTDLNFVAVTCMTFQVSKLPW